MSMSGITPVHYSKANCSDPAGTQSVPQSNQQRAQNSGQSSMASLITPLSFVTLVLEKTKGAFSACLSFFKGLIFPANVIKEQESVKEIEDDFIDDEQRLEIRLEYNQGFSIEQIAKKYCATIDVVNQAINND